ncbi:hypothetical protein K461DRAFT_285887 [Myriangium duriaei CBS 260.36]|uniref:BHLH domain-containing protein n=1 Tax=Myriangium duriaei CBS 260.36 TaxID=1168546 RepID=A0A9P4MH88_9PEZI|nr:hypothetical protein K461DRAFT_285887 [Myriangium duriaei CBS 260.36]
MESPLTHHAAQQHSPPHALPSITSLTNGLPPASQPSPHAQHQQYQQPPARDSGAWINSQSKHSSLNNGANNNGLHLSTLLNPEESQMRSSLPSTPTSARLSHASQALPSINQGFESHPQRDSLSRQSVDYHNTMESRRSSVDSRMHSNFNNLALNNPAMSPYESQHASQVSLASSLRRPDGQQQLSSPVGTRSMHRSIEHEKTRVAPAIVPNPRQFGAPDPTSARPTQGFPWAFPDSTGQSPEERALRRASSSESSAESQKMSRQGSYAASSVRSSVLSGELPPGQRRFEEGMGFQKIIGPVGHDGTPSKQELSMGHHPSMQHRTVTQLQNEHAAGLSSSGGYSRTPELRVSHKLAERKRRSEMKDLFEELNKAVPSNGGAKASKWEILSKAIDYIRGSRDQERAFHEEIARLRGDLEYARDLHKDNEALRTEICVMHERLRRMEPATPHIYGAYTSQLSQQTQPGGQPPQQHHGHHVGSLSTMGGSHSHQPHHAHAGPYSSISQSAPMQGVEYALPTRPSYEVR